jgi:hypothetical protein
MKVIVFGMAIVGAELTVYDITFSPLAFAVKNSAICPCISARFTMK